MIAILYLILVFLVGDRLGTRFLDLVSLPHRLAAGFLIGLLTSTWFTYLAAFAFSGTRNPMLWGNVVFFAAATLFLVLERRSFAVPSAEGLRKRFGAMVPGDRWDLVFIVVFALVAVWMMFATFGYSDGTVRIANHQWSDFGSTVSIMQSFADGNNFPTQYPHFSGDRIRYHFLFYFQAGNLEYLGLNPAMSNNLLSIFSLVAMLILVMTLGRALFNSRAAGRIGAVFFFFHGTLSFIPFVAGIGSVEGVLSRLSAMRDFLPSGFPYRGEEWGIWTQVVFLNQRHLASSIGILLIVLIHLALKCRRAAEPTDTVDAANGDGAEEAIFEAERPKNWAARFSPYVFLGVLLGLMPLYNGAVFAAAVAVLGLAFFLYLRFWREMIALAIFAGLVALPQVIYLKGGMTRPAGYSLLHWGYVIDDPSAFNVLYYLIFTFGIKLLLTGAAIYFSSGFQRRFLLAMSMLLPLTFLFQFSDELLTNHKFLNIWLVVLNVYAGYGIVRLWRARSGVLKLGARAIATVATAAIIFGGALDIFPIVNGYWVDMKYEGDPLVEWLRSNTDKKAIFLSQRYVNHRILLAGRRLFYGHPYYAWGAGHDTAGRDAVYKRLFESPDAAEVLELLKENNISYIAIDNGLRKDTFLKFPTESPYDKYFPVVFSDTQGQYDNLKIYEVPADPRAERSILTEVQRVKRERAPVADPFRGGTGDALGQFLRPRGIAVDKDGAIYVADTGNARVEKFDADGRSLMEFGSDGDNPGQFRELNGIAVDDAGFIWTVDASRHVLMKFDAAGRFVKEWKGPETNFYGPRDLAFGPNRRLYIVDQGRTRIVTFDPFTEQFGEWGSAGGGEGQFSESTGVGAGGSVVAVADTGNGRIQLFDLDGKFLRQWNVEAWARYAWNRPDVAVEKEGKLVYVSSGISRSIVVYDTNGNLVKTIKPEGADELNNPTSLVTADRENRSVLYVLNTGGEVGFSGNPRISVVDR